MKEKNIKQVGSKNAPEKPHINHQLTEDSFLMSHLRYLARIKTQLLREIISGTHHAKEKVKDINHEIIDQQETIIRQKTVLKHKNRELEQIHRELEERVKQRTADLEEANEHLRLEVAKRKKSEDTLRENKGIIEAFMQHSPAVTFIKDSRMRHCYVNSTFEKALDLKASEIYNKSNDEIFPPELAAKHNKSDYEVLREGKQVKQIDKLCIKDMPHEWLTYKFPILNSEGKPHMIGGISVDITSSRNTEEELKKNKWSMAIAQRVAKLGSWDWDLTANNMSWSDETYSIFGYEPGAILPRNEIYLNSLHPTDRDKAGEALKRALNYKEPLDIEYRIVKPNGEVCFIHHQAELVCGKDGTPVRMIGIIQDITERKEIEENLRVAKETAEEATKLKDKFISLVAHDLRSPFTTILGLMDIISRDTEDKLSDKNKDIFHRIQESGKNLLNMIDDLLNISRFQTGMIKPRPRFFDAHFAVLNVMAMSAYIAEDKGITLINEVPIDTRLYADLDLFSEVMQNLVSNAIKFSNKGDEVAIFVPPGQRSTIAVWDTGVGISKERLPKLFKYEEMTSTTGTAGERGTGLGLPFSMDIMQAHGGTIRMESTLGEESTFYAQLPCVRPRVLIVDDEVTERILIKEYLKNLGVEIIESENGEEALQSIKKRQPHLIIADIIMPVMDGFDLLERVKKDPETANIPVIVLTNDSLMETRNRAFQLGADDFVHKFIVAEDFIPRVKRFVV